MARAVLDTEVLVIGSGAGGAPTGALLAEAGFDVLIAEEGPWVRQGDVIPFSLDQMERQYRSGGVTVALGLPSIAYTEGRCAGGGTEVNSALYRRPPAEVVERWASLWNIRDLDPDDLALIADEVEKELSIGMVPGDRGAASERLALGAAKLGWRHEEIPRWMLYPPGATHRQGKRQSMTETYLPRATAAGARIITECRISRIERNRTGAVSARAVRTTEAGEQPVEIRFRHLFVCAGAIQTPALLQRSGWRRNIGGALAVHPTVKLAARFADAVNCPDDVPVHQVKEFTPGLSFGGSASNPGLMALSLADNWPGFGHAISDWGRMSVYYAAITSEGRGRVQALPGVRDPLVTYRLTARDRALLGSGMARLAMLMLEAGATDVFPSMRGGSVVRNRRDVGELSRSFSTSRAGVMTVHLCSTAPLGESDRCAVNSFGRVHGASNVYVNDASLLPDAPGVNPQGSVMALAIRNTRAFLQEHRPHA